MCSQNKSFFTKNQVRRRLNGKQPHPGRRVATTSQEQCVGAAIVADPANTSLAIDQRSAIVDPSSESIADIIAEAFAEGHRAHSHSLVKSGRCDTCGVLNLDNIINLDRFYAGLNVE